MLPEALEGFKPRRGITVAEILLILLFVLVLAALAIPRLVFALERSAQLSAMVDIDIWSRALEDYITEHGDCPHNPRGHLHYRHPIIRVLAPYLRAIRIYDPWGFHYHIWVGKGNRVYSAITSDHDFFVATYGRDGIQDAWRYEEARPEDRFFEILNRADFDKDIVNRNGKYVKRPR